MSAAATIRDALERFNKLADDKNECSGNVYYRWLEVREEALAALDELEAELAEWKLKERAMTDYFADASRRADEANAELERLTVGRATLEDQTNRAELAEARVEALEEALRQYADPTNWGIERTEFKYPRLVWIGPGAAQRVPDGISLARAVLVLSGGSE